MTTNRTALYIRVSTEGQNLADSVTGNGAVYVIFPAGGPRGHLFVLGRKGT